MTSTPSAPGRLLSVLFLGVLMGALDVAIVGPALPALGRAFAVDERLLAWVLTIYVLFNLVGTPITARLSDLHGRRELYAASVGLFALGSLVVALSPSFGWLLAGRALQGFGAGGVFPVATAVIGEVFPAERRGRALGMLGAVFGLAFLVGPILGGVLLRYGWPWLFLVNLPLAALVIVRGWRLLPAGRRGLPGRFDLPGVLLLSLGLALLALGLNALDAGRLTASLASPRVWPLLAGAVLAFAVLARVERAVEQPLISPALLREPQLAVANGLSAVAGIVEAGLVFVPSLLVTAFALAPADASLLLLPAVLAIAAGAPVSGVLLDRLGARTVVVAGAALLGAGLASLNWATAALPPFLLAGAVIGLGLASLVGAPLRYVVLGAAPAEYRAAAQAVSTLFRSVGRMAGSAAIGALVASRPGLAGYHLAFSVLAAVVALGAGLGLTLPARRVGRHEA